MRSEKRHVSAPETGPGALPASQRPMVPVNQAGARRLRPLARRRRIIARPERVRIRARNPWTFRRRRRFGWNVRFMGSGVGRAYSANWAESKRALAGGGGFQITPMRGTNERMYACFVGASTRFLSFVQTPRRPRRVTTAKPARRDRASGILLRYGFRFLFVFWTHVGRDSAPVLYSASSQRGSPPPSPRAADSVV